MHLSTPSGGRATPLLQCAGQLSIALSMQRCDKLLYFHQLQGDMLAYAPDCEFSDPFVAFKGTKRFQQNVGNLGGLM